MSDIGVSSVCDTVCCIVYFGFSQHFLPDKVTVVTLAMVGYSCSVKGPDALLLIVAMLWKCESTQFNLHLLSIT